MPRSPLFRTVAMDGAWKALSPDENQHVTATLSAPTGNSGNITLRARQDAGHTVTLAPGEWYSLAGVPLASIEATGTAGDAVVLVGGVD